METISKAIYLDRNGIVTEIDPIDPRIISISWLAGGRGDDVKLSNGVYLVGHGDGRYHVDGDELSPYSEVIVGEFYEDGEPIMGTVLGFIAI